MSKDQGQRPWLKTKRIKRRHRRRIKIFRTLLLLLLMFIFGWLFMQMYDWGTRTYNSYYASLQDYEKRRTKRGLSSDERLAGYTNVLLVGVDEGAAGTSGQQADTIILLSLDHSTGQVRLLSLPRGTIVMIPGQTVTQKLNYAYTLGGPQLLVRTTSLFLGVPVHQYLILDTKALVEVVDAFGGLDMYVETNMNYDDPEADLSIHLSQGFQHLDGQQVQQYLRYRGDDLGDIGRVHRQQKFMKAFYQRVLSLDTVTKIPQMADILKNRVTTSAEIFDAAQLVKLIKGLSGEPPQTVLLPGAAYNGDDTLWMTDPQAVQAVVAEMFPKTAGEKK